MSSEPKIEKNIEELKIEKNIEKPKIEKNIEEHKMEKNIKEHKMEKNIEEHKMEKNIEEPKMEKNIVIPGPEITQEYKNELINKLEKLEKIISGYFLIISSVSNKMMVDLGNDIYDCERKYNYMDIELKPFSKFVKNKYNFPYLKAKMKVVKNNKVVYHPSREDENDINYDIKKIINTVEYLKKRSEEIKSNIEQHEIEKKY